MEREGERGGRGEVLLVFFLSYSFFPREREETTMMEIG